MVSDAFWFGFVTLAIPVIFDRLSVRARWWMKYRFVPVYTPLITKYILITEIVLAYTRRNR